MSVINKLFIYWMINHKLKKIIADVKDCTSNESLLKNIFFQKYNTKNLFKNSHNYDIAFLMKIFLNGIICNIKYQLITQI